MLIVNKIITQIFFLESEIRFFAQPPPIKKKFTNVQYKKTSKKAKIAIDTYATLKKKYFNCINMTSY